MKYYHIISLSTFLIVFVILFLLASSIILFVLLLKANKKAESLVGKLNGVSKNSEISSKGKYNELLNNYRTLKQEHQELKIKYSSQIISQKKVDTLTNSISYKNESKNKLPTGKLPIYQESNALGESETNARVVELNPNENKEELNDKKVVIEGVENESNVLDKSETYARVVELNPNEDNDELNDKSVVIEGVESKNELVEVKSLDIPLKQFSPEYYFFDEFNNGIFKDKAKSEPYKCVYKISTTVGSNDIIELMVDQKVMTNYIINKNIYLPEYLCNINYITGGTQTKIQNIIPGKVRLENGEWKIQEKIKLEII